MHIISMAFGFGDRKLVINQAIEKASQAGKLMFAAASNGGQNKGHSYLGRDPNVICIHACDGSGNRWTSNPSPMDRANNFTTLGVAIESQWKGKTTYISGTSFATNVAVAIAADILESGTIGQNLSDEDKKLLYSSRGMQEIFLYMSVTRDGYDVVTPRALWGQREKNRAADTIKMILTTS